MKVIQSIMEWPQKALAGEMALLLVPLTLLAKLKLPAQDTSHVARELGRDSAIVRKRALIS